MATRRHLAKARQKTTYADQLSIFLDPAQVLKGEKVEHAITIKKAEAGVYCFIAANGDVQIGWCRKMNDGWWVEDTDCKRIGGPFATLKDTKEAGFQLLSHLAGESNPGH